MECPGCRSYKTHIQVTDKFFLFRCNNGEKVNGKDRLVCGFKIMHRLKNEAKIRKRTEQLSENSTGEKHDTNFPKGFEGILPCPICKYQSRLIMCMNKFVCIRCAICASTIYIKPKYLDNLYSPNLVHIEEIKW
jgi:hypothetical protein